MSIYSRTNLFKAKILERVPLTKNGSTKETFHLVLGVRDFPFKVGDSIGVFPTNDPAIVDQILITLHATGRETVVDRSKTSMTFREFLLHKANLCKCTSAVLKLIPKYEELLEDKTRLLAFLETHHLVDILTGPLCPQELCNALLPLMPRFYSIASSPNMFSDQIHLAVASLTYQTAAGPRRGVGSHFLCHMADETTAIPIYVQSSNGFTLPENPDAAIIMIGPGTGIAPFRAFLQEREFHQHKGKNWLFFGERNRATDFYYADYLLALESQNRLRLDLAFSRDSAEKTYVQHLLWQERASILNWIENGAYLYVCGDASKMAKDVDATLQKIAGEEKIKEMRKARRYLTDVY